MRIGGVPVTALLLLASLAIQVSYAEDIYWEGEEDAFLEVKPEDTGLASHLQRFKRDLFDSFSFFGNTPGDKYETATEDDDTSPDGKEDDLETDGSGQPDNRIETELREKTLRVTFVVMEPYREKYSNRDSIEFQNLSQSLADSVNLLFESLPGTQKASLVRIQSRLDGFSCKVTLDIVTTGYDNTDRITQILRDHIKNRALLGNATVKDDDFSATVIDPGTTLSTCSVNDLQCNDGSCIPESARCNGHKDCNDGSDEARCVIETYQEQTNIDKPGSLPEDENENEDDGDNEITNENFNTVSCPDPLPCYSSSKTYCNSQRCDGTEDCPFGEDEKDCESIDEDTYESNTNAPQRGDQSLDIDLDTTTIENDSTTSRTTVPPPESDLGETLICLADEIRCDFTRCIKMSQRCDSRADCDDGTDEADCPESCGTDDFRCDNGKCIEGIKRCDGVSDCLGDEDEKNCACRSDEFRCVSDGSCIENRKRCDGIANCNDRSDEVGCACRSDQWQCDFGNCIKRSMRCDGRIDCPTDRSDERNCYANGYFKCRTGKLISDSLRCNRRYDCPRGDYSDEQNCPCGEGDFKCDNGHCIPAYKHCDRTHDCQDGSDERLCTYGTVCMAYQFKCTSGKCVVADSWCNGTADCDDGSDEMNCPCKRGQFQCNDGSCVNIALRCNGHSDCRPHGEDEFNCGGTQCPPEFNFTCGPLSSNPCAKQCDGVVECDGSEDEESCKDTCNHFCDGRCLDDDQICDGSPHCTDGSDETNCDKCDGPEDFRCNTGECLHIDSKCNNITECPRGDDELNCNATITPTSSGCLSNQFTCKDGTCIDIQFYCDKRQDCYDNSDEENCPTCASSDEFKCRDDTCISSYDFCNGRPDCPDGSDEENCPWYMMRASRSPVTTPCKFTEFTCYNGRCIPLSRRCDNIYDCSDFSDEQKCHYPACDANSWQCRSGQCVSEYARCDGRVDCDDSSDEEECSTEPTLIDRSSTTTGPIYTTTQPSVYDKTPLYPPRIDGSREEPGIVPGRPLRPGADSNVLGGSSNDNGGYPYPKDPNQLGGYDPYGPGSDSTVSSYVPGGEDKGRGTSRPEYYGGDNKPYAGTGDSNRNKPPGFGVNEGESFGSENNKGDRNEYDANRNKNGGESVGPGTNSGGRDQYGIAGSELGGPFVSGANGGESVRPGTESSSSYGLKGSGERGIDTVFSGPATGNAPYGSGTNGGGNSPYGYGNYPPRRNEGPVALNIKTYPQGQVVRYGGDVVFQCRDESSQRAPVRWVKEGGRPLKTGSRDVNGRLEMFGVTPSDSGIYICQAPSFLRYPGSEVRVTLEVETAPVTLRPAFITCQQHEATCGNGQCIPKSAVCDGKVDCADSSDEDTCHTNGMCEPNQFQCNNGKCVLKTWLCDSDNDCDDNSDEENCAVSDPGHPCKSVEFTCSSGTQCVPKSYHCDGQSDCMDGSDEIGCAPVHVTRPPKPSNVRLNPGDTLTLVCEAIGMPVPLISWRLNWGHVPSKCTSVSQNGIGTLTCNNMEPQDSGAYSCEAMNNKGTTFAAPDSIVHVNKTDPCPPGYFNNEARSQNECIRCFCFGESTQCRSADLFTYNMPTALGEGGTRLLGVTQTPNGEIRTDSPIGNQYLYQPLRNGATVTKVVSDDAGWQWSSAHPYLTLPETYNGNQLTSYGGHIKYILSPHAPVYAPDTSTPTIIIKGKYGNLFHYHRGDTSRNTNIEARLTPENWEKPSPRGLVPATREDIMMTLDNIEQILLRADLNNAGVNISDFAMESAQHINVGLGVANLVEECTCPPGYEGLSCERCAIGYVRESTGPWLGNCVRETCPPGTYGDPASGYACKPCPCPLTNRDNQFARTCSIGHDGNVVCDCNPGYEGKRCEVCAPGYVGNPIIPGDSCKLKPSDNCNPTGTRYVRPPDECDCKDNVQGRYCDQCKNDSFYLSEDFRHGCAICFCSGVSQECRSSDLRRKTTAVQFNVPDIVNQVEVYNSAPAGPAGSVRYTVPLVVENKPELVRGQIALPSLERSQSSVYYWSLPNSFAGDKVTSYGGYLHYTLQNVPTYDNRLRNNAADVQLISLNHLTFHYTGNFQHSFDGTLNASVQFLEKGWQRIDGKEVSREHFLLALADVKTILIKATYSDNAPLATPLIASIETAEPTGDGPRALHVEQCVCPSGYVGTSCEDCAPGFTRSSSGLYLEHCGPCLCNGHSNMCHPETGICYDCADFTDGPHCEICKSGYERDSYGNCVQSNDNPPTCSCDPAGSAAPCDESRYCYCKEYVEGENCDKCRSGTFGLDSANPLGCQRCYCSGVTTDCHEGNHYTRIPIAAPILGDTFGGFTIMDINAEQVINDDFVPAPDKSELMYVFSFVPRQELYWSLPVFPGNRILSYGGFLYLRQEFRSNDYGAVSEPGIDVVLVGDDDTLYWTNPNRMNAGWSLTYQVPLREHVWYIQNTATPVTRDRFLRVLANLKRVLVRATVAANILSTSIADVSMDTATISNDPELPAATGIEICMCPPGYSGTSCESCASGYYKDQTGRCQKCSCNGHDCQLDAYGRVVCNCRPPYTGSDCLAIGLVMELHPTIHDDGVNSTFYRRVTLTCKYRAPEPLTILFYHEGHEQWPPKYYNESKLHKDGWHGEHVWQTVWDTRRQGEIYECHTVTEKGFTLGVLTTSLPEPAGEPTVVSPTTLSPPFGTTVVVKITSPTIKIQEVGSSVNFTCQAESPLTNSRLRISWSKVDGYLPQGRTQIDENSGVLLITNLQVSDSGQYICQTSDGVSTGQAIATLKVPGNEMTMPTASINPTINEYYEGDRIELRCDASGNPAPTIRWQRASNRPLPASAEHFDERLIIESALEEDSGEYRCIASNAVGSADRTAIITVRPRPSLPPRDKLTVSPTSPTVDEGQSTRVVCTGTTNVPAGSIDWIRQDGVPLSANVRSENGVLYIDYVRLEDRGVYVCQTSAPNVVPVPVLLTVVPQGTPSPSDASNITVSVDRLKVPTGDSGTVDCNPQGYPLPLIKWSKHQSTFGPGTSQRGNTLIINRAQEDDQGYYLCEGIVNGSPVAYIYVFVEVEKREEPRVEIWPPGEQMVPLGLQYELHCRVTGGYPEPDVTWSRSGGKPLATYAHIQPHNVLKFDHIDVNDEGEYTCTATNVAGMTSASAVLKVRSSPEITISPSNFLQVLQGESVLVECRASGYPDPTVSIKTSVDLREVVPPSPRIAVLSIPSASERNSGDYICVATSPAGTVEEQFGIRVERGDGGVTVLGGGEGSGDDETEEPIDQYPPDPNRYPPDSNSRPEELIALEGQPEITINCNGSEGFEPRWSRVDRRPFQRNAFQRDARLIIYNVSKSDSSQYVCSLYNINTREIAKAAYIRLLVISVPRITLRPPNQTVRPGQSPTVECVVEGDDIIDITWKPYNRAPSRRVEPRGATLIFHQIEVEDAGKYECFARNRYANASAIAEVIVSEENNRPASESHNNEQFAHSGAAVHLSCNVTQPNLIIEWTKDGRPVPRSRQKHDGSLFIKIAQKSDSGRYVCHIRDIYGRHTSNYINLHIEGIECLETEFRCYDLSGCIDEELLCDDFQDCKDNSDEENCLYRDKRYSDSIWDDYMDQLIPVAGPTTGGEEQAAELVSIVEPRSSYRVSENVEVVCRSIARNINVRWERYGTNQYVESKVYGDGAVLIIHGVQESDAGVYRCTGMDPYGATFYRDFRLVVVPGYSGPTHSDNSVALARYEARLSDSIDLPCQHTLEEPVTIEWRKEYSSLPANSASNQPTLHIESVTEADAGTYICRVSNNRQAIEARAILRVTGVVPRFDGESWLSQPPLKDAYKQFDIEVSFRPMDHNGLILYNSENQGRTGDYVALQLIEGIPQFLLETGAGIVKVKGDRPLQLNEWHTIRISRTGSRLTMDVDNTGPFIAESPDQWTVLELKQPLYIGGVPDFDQLPIDLAGASGFVGCISMLILGNEEKNIMALALDQENVQNCFTCAPNLCLNDGVCQEALTEHGYVCLCAPGFGGTNCDRIGESCRPGLCGPGKCMNTADGYKCACPVTYTGKNCEVKQSIEYPAFTGSAYLAIKPPTTTRSLKMSMKIKAASPVTDGIIMYCAETLRGYGGFTSLAVHNGKLEFRYDLGGGSKPVVLTSNKTLPANEWTDVHIARLGRSVSLKINLVHSYEQWLEGRTESLRLETPMFVGGVDESVILNNNTGVTGGYSGCIKDVMIYENAVDIVNSSIQSANVQECSNYDRGDIPEAEGTCQCRNGGSCPVDSISCVCPIGYTGTYCEHRVPNPLITSRLGFSDPCSLHPCRNGGTCKSDLSSRMNHTCDCPLGFAGASCQMPLQLLQSVGFSGNGYLELPAGLLRYDDLQSEPAVIALAIHTTTDGVLLYQREALSPYDRGDFILLRIERGVVVLDWDLGSGISTITIENIRVNDGERHQIIAKLHEDNTVTLSVDSATRTGTTTGLSNLMSADSNIYIGGMPDRINLRGYPGLIGCIEQVELMGTSRGLNLGQVAVAGRNTQRCREYTRY